MKIRLWYEEGKYKDADNSHPVFDVDERRLADCVDQLKRTPDWA